MTTPAFRFAFANSFVSAKKTLIRLGASAPDKAGFEMQNLAEVIQKYARERIAFQYMPGIEPLAEGTVERKGHGNIFFETGKYIQEIKINAGRKFSKPSRGAARSMAQTGRKGYVKWVIAPSNAVTSRGGISYHDLMEMLEKGYTSKIGNKQVHIPARPFWAQIGKHFRNKNVLSKLFKSKVFPWIEQEWQKS